MRTWGATSLHWKWSAEHCSEVEQFILWRVENEVCLWRLADRCQAHRGIAHHQAHHRADQCQTHSGILFKRCPFLFLLLERGWSQDRSQLCLLIMNMFHGETVTTVVSEWVRGCGDNPCNGHDISSRIWRRITPLIQTTLPQYLTRKYTTV